MSVDKVESDRIWKALMALASKMEVTIHRKESSWLMWMLAPILYFIQGFRWVFMRRYTTTVGTKVYFPAKVLGDKWRASRVMAHELVHVKDLQIMGWKSFIFHYYSPQIFGLISLVGLLGFVFPGYYLFLFGFFILFAAPWPSKGRTNIELRGYALSIACTHWKYPFLKDSKEWREIMLARYYETFTGWGYWKMSWNKEYIDEELGKIVELILEDRLGELIPISDEIRRIYKDQNV